MEHMNKRKVSLNIVKSTKLPTGAKQKDNTPGQLDNKGFMILIKIFHNDFVILWIYKFDYRCCSLLFRFSLFGKPAELTTELTGQPMA